MCADGLGLVKRDEHREGKGGCCGCCPKLMGSYHRRTSVRDIGNREEDGDGVGELITPLVDLLFEGLVIDWLVGRGNC